ncbi:MAG: sialate O-acetylesterase [Oscillospiraceae bacterium]
MKNELIESQMNDTPFDIIVVAGQSNAYGYGRGFTHFHKSNKIMMLYYDCIWSETEPLFPTTVHFNIAKPWENRTTSFSLYFAQEYIKNDLANGRKLLILNVAVGGTGFLEHRWGEGECLYETAIEFIEFALKQNSENRIVGFLWHQGETDVQNCAKEDFYFGKLKTLIAGFRQAAKNDNLPFITGDMTPQYKAETPATTEIINANKRIEKEVPKVKFVSSDGLFGNKPPDHIHFSTKSNIEFGKRYYEAFKSIK